MHHLLIQVINFPLHMAVYACRIEMLDMIYGTFALFFFLYIFIVFARSGLTIRSTSMDLMFYGDDWNTENYKSMYC